MPEIKYVVTSVRLPLELHEWIKTRDCTVRGLIEAGRKRLVEGDIVTLKEQEIAALRYEMQSSARHKEMIWYIFQRYPDIYNEARTNALKDDKESA